MDFEDNFKSGLSLLSALDTIASWPRGHSMDDSSILFFFYEWLHIFFFPALFRVMDVFTAGRGRGRYKCFQFD